jgi:hypothetical protein
MNFGNAFLPEVRSARERASDIRVFFIGFVGGLIGAAIFSHWGSRIE